jgi:predicted PhzF superfamily epimerase YddE/YHI9
VSRGEASPGVTAERTGYALHEPPAGWHAWLDSSFADGFGHGNPAGVVSPARLSDPIAKAARVRDFCAAIGALEKPASDTTTADLYLAAHGALEAPELAIGQGVEMERPSRLEVTVAAPDGATVRGRAPKLLSGPLELRRGDAW